MSLNQSNAKFLYKIQQVKFFEAASELLWVKTEKNGQQTLSRCNSEGNYAHP